jgi:hypothetical protein
MPYEIRKTKGGYKVGHKGQSKTYSDKPMSKSKAKKQMRAMYMHSGKEAKGG